VTKRVWRTQLSFAVILGLACSPGSPDEGETAESEAAAGEVQRDLHLEPAAVEAWDIQVAPVGTTAVRGEIVLPGILAENDNRTARIAPLVDGQVAEIYVDLGSRVGAGQTLATLNSTEFTRAQTDFMRTFARAELSQTEFERARVLRERQAIEEREFLRRESIHEQNLADLRAAEVTLHSLGVSEDGIAAIQAGVNMTVSPRDHRAVEQFLPVRSPISGVVTERNAILGDHVAHGQPLFTVSDLSVLWARLDAYENQLPMLDPGVDLVLTLPLFPEREFPGRITYVADNVDEELRTVRVRAEVPNVDGSLKPNMYVQGFVQVLGEGEERVLVPEEAIQLLDGESVVFVQEPPEEGESHLVFEVRKVEAGETLRDGRIVLAGLEPGELVVNHGAFTLKAELTKGAGGHDHAH
jgi:cobalt-zinc-cadmium efflux system membrane fusion protein